MYAGHFLDFDKQVTKHTVQQIFRQQAVVVEVYLKQITH
jgi:hypothetical protein